MVLTLQFSSIWIEVVRYYYRAKPKADNLADCSPTPLTHLFNLSGKSETKNLKQSIS